MESPFSYVTEKRPQKILRMPIEGGVPPEIADVRGDINAGRLSISPDGQFLAYVSQEDSPAPLWKVTTAGIGGGPPVRAFKVPGGIRKLSWFPSAKGLQIPFDAEWRDEHLGTAARRGKTEPAD